MGTRVRRPARRAGLLLGFLAVLALTLLPAHPAAALTQVGAADCGTTFTTPDIYSVVADLNCSGDGLRFESGASGSILLLNGHTLTGAGTGAGRGIDVNASSVQVVGPGTVRRFETGIRLLNASGVQVVNLTATENTAVGFSRGIGLFNSNGNQIANCTSTRNLFGIELLNSNDNQIASCTTSNNGFFGIAVGLSDRNAIQGNTANNNPGAGISVEGSNNVIQGNTTNSNHIGIQLAAATFTTVQGNTALGNVTVDLLDTHPTCDDNTWQGNTFRTRSRDCIN